MQDWSILDAALQLHRGAPANAAVGSCAHLHLRSRTQCGCCLVRAPKINARLVSGTTRKVLERQKRTSTSGRATCS